MKLFKKAFLEFLFWFAIGAMMHVAFILLTQSDTLVNVFGAILLAAVFIIAGIRAKKHIDLLTLKPIP